MAHDEQSEAPELVWRRETIARLALGGGLLFAGGWAYLSLRLVRSAPREAARAIRTGLRPGTIGRGIRTFGRAFLLWGKGRGVKALDRRCTHLGCHVRAANGDGEGEGDGDGVFECPCHGSCFDRQGRVLNGPATRPLRRLRTSVDSRGEVVIHVED